eukprot:2903179-Pleurochrysis_carterae.AAC.2
MKWSQRKGVKWSQRKGMEWSQRKGMKWSQRIGGRRQGGHGRRPSRRAREAQRKSGRNGWRGRTVVGCVRPNSSTPGSDLIWSGRFLGCGGGISGSGAVRVSNLEPELVVGERLEVDQFVELREHAPCAGAAHGDAGKDREEER